MNLMADEGVDAQIVDRLREEGYEVVYIAELDPGIDDELVLSLASRSGSLLITSDKDFGELIFRLQRASGGVALLRLAGLSPEKKATIVAASLRTHGDEMAAAFTVISPANLRIRKRKSI